MSHRKQKTWLIVLAGFFAGVTYFVAACNALVTPGSKKEMSELTVNLAGARVTSLEKRVISEKMSDVEKDACNSFQLSQSGVLTFFRQARVISTEDLAATYYALPCKYDGVFSIENHDYRFEINAGATGLLWVDKSYPIYFGCGPRCNNIIDVGLYSNTREQ